MHHFRKNRWLIGPALAILALAIHRFASSAFIESWYGHGLYPAVRWILDHTISLLGFPFFYVLLIGIIAWVTWRVRRIREISPRKVSAWKDFGKALLSFAGWVVFLFYFMWGFNYDRLSMEQRLSWQPGPVEQADFLTECQSVARSLTDIRTKNDEILNETLLRNHYNLLEVTLRKSSAELAEELGYKVSGKIRCRQLVPAGILLRWGTAGFYNPLSGECNIDPGLHKLQKPFVMAHEFFHALGVTGEGDCNFLAYVLCSRSPYPLIKYSGELGYWRYLRHSFRRLDPERYENTVAAFPTSVQKDLEEIDRAIRKYPDIAPRFRNVMYNAYLKSNKIHDGMANYNRIVNMVINWKRNRSSW